MISGAKKFHLLFAFTAFVLAIYLGAKTFPEEGWPGWSEFSAQTLLSTEHWAKDGFLKHKLLFIPIGYSKAVQYLDEPEIRHHARGTVTGYLIGRRLYYTHYPSGYLIPYALLKKAGVDERHWFRINALAFSLVGLTLMYVFLNIISNPFVAYFGTLYYGLSTMFLDFADSLANQPIDDLFRFAILIASVLAYRNAADEKLRRRYTVITWALFLLLSLSSYDSIFFVYAWIVGLDLIAWYRARGTGEGTSLPWKRWIFLATPPVIGFSLQILQNWSYLGWHDLVLDFKGVFLYRMGSAGTDIEEGGLLKHFKAVLTPVYLMTGLKAAAVPAILFIAGVYAFFRRKAEGRHAELSLLLLLFLAGSCYNFLFAKSDDLNYQGRQLAPALGLLTASALGLVAQFFSPRKNVTDEKAAPRTAPAILIMAIAAVSLALLWSAQIKRTIGYVREWPNNAVNPIVLADYKAIGSLTENDGVIFYIDANAGKRYPQPPPSFEFYAGKTVLFFQNAEDALRDFAWLRKRSEHPFTAVICSPQKEAAELFLPFAAQPPRVISGHYYAVIVEPG